MILSLNHPAGLQPTLIGLGMVLSFATVDPAVAAITIIGAGWRPQVNRADWRAVAGVADWRPQANRPDWRPVALEVNP